MHGTLPPVMVRLLIVTLFLPVQLMGAVPPVDAAAVPGEDAGADPGTCKGTVAAFGEIRVAGNIDASIPAFHVLLLQPDGVGLPPAIQLSFSALAELTNFILFPLIVGLVTVYPACPHTTTPTLVKYWADA